MNDGDRHLKLRTQTHQTHPRETTTTFFSHGPARARSPAAAHRRGATEPARTSPLQLHTAEAPWATSPPAKPQLKAESAGHVTGLDIQQPMSSSLRLPRNLNANRDSPKFSKGPLVHTRKHVTQPRASLPKRRRQVMIHELISKTEILRTSPPAQPQHKNVFEQNFGEN
jgi:hypothetical protein